MSKIKQTLFESSEIRVFSATFQMYYHLKF
jgi:hypothetical protein